MLLVSLSVLGLLVGAALVVLGNVRAETASALDGLTLGMLPALVLARLLPHAFESLGLAALVLAGIGFGGVALAHRGGAHAETRLGHSLVMPALWLHALSDGAALAMSTSGHAGASGMLLAVALILHRIPEGLFVASTRASAGSRAAVLAVMPLALFSIAGAVLGENAFGIMPDGAVDAVLALGAGALLRLVAHTHEPASPQPRAANALGGLAFLGGIALVLAIPGPDDVLMRAQPRELSIAASALPLFVASAPSVLLGLVAAAALRALAAANSSEAASSSEVMSANAHALPTSPTTHPHEPPAALSGEHAPHIKDAGMTAVEPSAALSGEHAPHSKDAGMSGVKPSAAVSSEREAATTFARSEARPALSNDQDARARRARAEGTNAARRPQAEATAADSGSAVHAHGTTPAPRQVSIATSLRAALRGVGWGHSSPLCSCGVLPEAQRMFASGWPAASVLAFATATPVLALDAAFLSLRLLGAPLTLARIAGGVVLSLAVALLAARVAARGPRPLAAVSGRDRPLAARGWLQESTALLDHTGAWLVLGLLIAAAVEAALNPALLGRLGEPWSALLAAVLALPMYVCAQAATPLAAVLLHKGASVGAALAFLWIGPALSMPLLGLLRRTVGRRATAAIALGSVLAAAAISVTAGWLVAPNSVPEVHPLLSSANASWEQALALVLGALLLSSLLRLGPRAFFAAMSPDPHAHFDHTATSPPPAAAHSHLHAH